MIEDFWGVRGCTFMLYSFDHCTFVHFFLLYFIEHCLMIDDCTTGIEIV